LCKRFILKMFINDLNRDFYDKEII